MGVSRTTLYEFTSHRLIPPGVDVEAAKRAEEELLLHDTRCWLNGGAMPEARHPRTGASALHVAAAKGYIEVMR
jgi:protein phosphatase 1 regulatory subunit 12C